MAHTADVVDLFGRSEPRAGVVIALLGPLKLIKAGTPFEITGPKRRALLTLLALNLGRPVATDEIIEALWPGPQSGREESTLRVHISHLRDELEPQRDGDPTVIVTRGSAYMLSGDDVAVDTGEFERLREEGRARLDEEPVAALSILNQALALWRGRALHDVEYEEFAQEAIRSLDFARQETLEDRAKALVEIGEDASAIDDLESLVRSEPTRERPLLLLMKALYRTGRHSDALRCARRHRRQLADQGLEPSPRLLLLEDQILNHDPELLPLGVVSAAEVKVGRSVRGYELREEVGAGSMGTVYRAFQPAVGREVAVKVIDPDLAQTPEFVRRFVEESRVVANLEHPHIVPLYDFWREPAGAFVTMRWMDGGSLADRIDRPRQVDDIGRIFSQVADALGYAHSAGVVHRDLRPANILFDSADNAYLCDFRLAVPGAYTGGLRARSHGLADARYAAPEVNRGGRATAVSDMYSLGVILGEAVARTTGEFPLEDVREVVRVATSTRPADRYPDIAAFVAALVDALGDAAPPIPRQVRRNPYKGLEAFDEGDQADFYGRDDVIESLLDSVGPRGLTALIGASGGGKSSVVRAGLVPQLRAGSLAGSEEWTIIRMVPGVEPYDEFNIRIRAAAFGNTSSGPGRRANELHNGFTTALDGPNSRGLLVVDQFEELFSSEIDEETRERFLDDVVELALDPGRRVRVVVVLRADFSDRPLTHPRFGELMSKGTVLLAPMRPEQIEDVIRRPAARVGIRVEPGLISEIVSDISSSSVFLPHLEYVLAELFEHRVEDRLTIRAYRSLGGVQGVLERRAESTYSTLDPGGRDSARQLFLRMVHIGDHGEETRRRLPITELDGLGRRADVDSVLQAFDEARLIAYGRDPSSRTPTVEVAHETVIARWTRFRVWIDEARADLLAHRRLSSAADAWERTEEDPSYLLTGGPLATARELLDAERVELNERESRFVGESSQAEEKARHAEEERRRHEEALERRSRRRFAIGVGTAVLALTIGVLAVFAFAQRQRANELATTQSSENLARELAATSISTLDSADPDLSLLLAIAAAEETARRTGGILPEAVEALHRAVINPRPDLIVANATGRSPGNESVAYTDNGSSLIHVTEDGGIAVVDLEDGSELFRIDPVGSPAFGVHLGDGEILSVHNDGFRVWDAATMELTRGETAEGVSAGTYSRRGSLVAIGDSRGGIRVYDEGGLARTLEAEHVGPIMALDFDPSGSRLVSAGFDGVVLVWDLSSQSVTATAPIRTELCVYDVAWHPVEDVVAVTLCQGEAFTFDAVSGERLHAFGLGDRVHTAIGFDSSGALVGGSGDDGFTRVFNSVTGGAPVIALPNGGVPVRDVEFHPGDPRLRELVTLGADGDLRVWRDLFAWSELTPFHTTLLYPQIAATPDGRRYVVGSGSHIFGVPQHFAPFYQVVESSSGSALRTLETRQDLGLPHRPAISNDGALAAFPGSSGDVAIILVDDGVVKEIPESTQWTRSLDFDDDADLLAGVGSDGLVALFDVEEASLIRVMSPGTKSLELGQELLPDPQLHDVSFIPGSHEVVTAGADGSVRVWDVSRGSNRLLHVFEFAVWSVDVSDDGSTIAAADTSGNVVALSVETGEELVSMQGLPGRTDITFSPHGRYLAGGGPGSRVSLWDMETGAVIRRFRDSVGKPTVAFVNGGTEIRAASAEGLVRGYVLDPGRLLEIARGQVERAMTDGECQRYLRKPCGA